MYTNKSTLWVKILQEKYLESSNNTRIMTIENPPGGLALWNLIFKSREIITSYITWEVHYRLK